MMMENYYRDRALEYDLFYEVPERQHDLALLKSWLLEHARDRSILEVATGTGYWTEFAATVAKAITATDDNLKCWRSRSNGNSAHMSPCAWPMHMSCPNSPRLSTPAWRTCGGPM